MKTIVDIYLNGANKAEKDRITKQLKDQKYARLEVNLRHPDDHSIFIPQH